MPRHLECLLLCKGSCKCLWTPGTPCYWFLHCRSSSSSCVAWLSATSAAAFRGTLTKKTLQWRALHCARFSEWRTVPPGLSALSTTAFRGRLSNMAWQCAVAQHARAALRARRLHCLLRLATPQPWPLPPGTQANSMQYQGTTEDTCNHT